MKLFILNVCFFVGLLLLFAIIQFDIQRLNAGFIVYMVIWITSMILLDAKQRNERTTKRE
ncbi:MAG: hypothetical protein KBT36_03985 [Kurthia sp.]|nr:hypothetical protein [Candidatus Kurthia equi]